MDIQRNKLFPDFWSGCEMSFKYHSYEQNGADWCEPPHIVTFSRIDFILDGTGVYYSNDQRIEVKPGNVYLIPASIPSGYFTDDTITHFGFEFWITMPDGLDFFSSCKRYLSYEYPVEAIKELAENYISEDPAQMLRLKGAVWEAVARFSQMLSPEEKRRLNYPDIVRQAIGYIHLNLSSALTIKEISEGIFASPGTVSKYFRKHMGCSLRDYIERVIMMKAQQMLLCSNKSIGTISRQLGYCDQFYFSRRFKKIFLLSPQEFRKVGMRKPYGFG